MFYLLSKPDEWKCQLYDLEHNSSKDGIKAIQSAMKELAECGYARLKHFTKNEDKFMGSYYEVSDKPTSIKKIELKPKFTY